MEPAAVESLDRASGSAGCSPRADRARARGAARRFAVALALIVFAALVLRVVYVVTVARNEPTRNDPDAHVYDATYYELQARSIVNGDGFFTDPFLLFREPVVHRPAADHPPLTVLSLLPAALVEGPDRSNLAMRLTMVLVGVANVVLIACLARRLGGDTVGLVAAAIAAVDPNLWMNDALIMSESLSVLFVVGLVSASYHVLRRGITWRWVVGLGVLSGLGALARAEVLALVPLIVVPALWIASQRNRRLAVGAIAAVAAVALVVVAPWVAFNLSRFERSTLISTNDGLTLAAANCDAMYSGPRIGWANVFEPCAVSAEGLEQSVWNAENRTRGLRYIRDHIGRVPVVALARLGRALHVYAPNQTAFFTSGEGRPEWASWMGAVATWALIPLAVVGGIRLRRLGQPIWLLVVPIVVACALIAFVTGGLPRYLVSAEVSMVVLGATGVVALVTRLRGDAPPTMDGAGEPAVSARAGARASSLGV